MSIKTAVSFVCVYCEVRADSHVSFCEEIIIFQGLVHVVLFLIVCS